MDHKSTKQENLHGYTETLRGDYKEEEPWGDDYKEIYRRGIKARYEYWMP